MKYATWTNQRVLKAAIDLGYGTAAASAAANGEVEMGGNGSARGQSTRIRSRASERASREEEIVKDAARGDDFDDDVKDLPDSLTVFGSALLLRRVARLWCLTSQVTTSVIVRALKTHCIELPPESPRFEKLAIQKLCFKLEGRWHISPTTRTTTSRRSFGSRMCSSGASAPQRVQLQVHFAVMKLQLKVRRKELEDAQQSLLPIAEHKADARADEEAAGKMEALARDMQQLRHQLSMLQAQRKQEEDRLAQLAKFAECAKDDGNGKYAHPASHRSPLSVCSPLPGCSQ
eukprot:3618107-Pleurochrysis_carterae.AAC.1